MAFHRSVREVLSRLKSEHPGVSLAAFGQTVFWDEPTKCVLVPMLEAYYPATEGYAILEKNDGPTRDMWASVGEMSALFGAEVVPTRARLAAAGVNLQRLEGSRYQRLLKSRTTAVGWRALVETGSGGKVFRDVGTREVADRLLELLEWALGETLGLLGCPRSPAHRRQADALLEAVRRRADAPENRHLADLYADLWPFFYETLLRRPMPPNVNVTRTSALFRFNRETCRRPRFRLVDHFLNPKTAPLCREAYSASLHGSGIYELDRFGSEAIPFDLVVPGTGRGTITIGRDHVLVHADPHLVVDLDRPVTCAADLAAAVEDALGPDVALVGKAVALAYMITSEFVFALNEGASPYVARTRDMVRHLRAAGIADRLNPVLRLRYPTWRSLRATDVRLRLNEDLAAAFGQRSIAAGDFAAQWRTVVRRQKRLLKALGRARSPQDLMELLSRHDHPEWLERRDAYLEANRRLLEIQAKVNAEKAEANLLRERLRHLKAEADRLQKERGRTSRAVKALQQDRAQPGGSREEARAAARALRCREQELAVADRRLGEARRAIGETEARRQRLVAAYRALETGPDAREVRKLLKKLETRAEAVRLVLASRAIRVGENLSHANRRPTAWWFPVVDPSGAWFQTVLEGTALALEEMA